MPTLNPAVTRSKSLWLLAAAAVAVASLLTLFQKEVVKTSCIDNIAELRYELGCRDTNQQTCIDDWLWEQRTPYKYRILGRVPIWALSEAGISLGIDQDHAVYYSFVAFLLLFMASTLFLLGLLTRTLLQRIAPELPRDMQSLLTGLAWALFLLSPPILFFVKYPVRGAPNDLLGYSLMIGALLLLAQRRIAWFGALSVVAVFCRETTLLVPFIFLFFDPLPWRKKLLPATLPLAVLVAYRTAWPGLYDPIPAGILLNLKFPAETLGFVLLTFGPLWLLAPLGYASLRRQEAAQRDPFVRTLTASFPWAFLLTMGICTAFTSLWEIRTSYILLFYFVPFSAIGLYLERARIAALLKNKYFLLFIAALSIEAFRFWMWMHPTTLPELLDRAKMFDLLYVGYANSPQHNWINIFVVYLFLSAACLPALSLLARPPASVPNGPDRNTSHAGRRPEENNS